MPVKNAGLTQSSRHGHGLIAYHHHKHITRNSEELVVVGIKRENAPRYGTFQNQTRVLHQIGEHLFDMSSPAYL